MMSGLFLWWLAELAHASDPFGKAAPIEIPPDPSAPAEIAAPTEGILTGRVLEFGSGLPVSGTFQCDGAEPAPLDEKGRFTCTLASGSHEVTVEGPDHKAQSTVEMMVAGETLEVIYRLERYSWAETIIVYGESKREEVSRQVFTAEELSRVPGAMGDPIRALQALPGVARPAGLEGGIVVRGAEALNTATYIDEVPVPYLFHFFFGRSVINPTVINDIEFFAGGMPSRFGDSTQAVVNARTLDLEPKPGWHGKIGVSLMDFSISGEGRLAKHWTWQGAYRVSWIGALIGVGARIYAYSQGIRGERPGYPSISYTDYLARIAYENGPDRLVLTGLGSRDILKFVPPRYDQDGDGKLDPPEESPLPYDPNQLMNTGFHRIHLRWDRKLDGREETTWIATGPDAQGSLFEGIGTLTDGVELGQLTGWSFLGKRSDRFPMPDGSAVRTGIDFQLQPVRVEDYHSVSSTGRATITKDQRTTFAGYIEWQKTIGKAFLSPGFRGSAHAFNGDTWLEPEPRLTFRYQLHPRWTLTSFVGRFSQIPPADRYANGLGNPNLSLITAWQLSSGLEGRWSNGLEIDVSIYGSRSDNLVVKDQRVIVAPPAEAGEFGDFDAEDWDGGPQPAQTQVIPTYNSVTGYAFGLDGMIRLRPRGPWFGWVALTLGRSLRVDDDGNVELSNYDTPFNFVAVAAADLPRDWRISGKARLTTGYPYTPLHGVYDAQYDTWSAITGDTNSERFGWFSQVDLRVDKTWTKKRARVTMYFDIMNVFNTSNWLVATYNTKYTKLQKSFSIPITPDFGLEVAY